MDLRQTTDIQAFFDVTEDERNSDFPHEVFIPGGLYSGKIILRTLKRVNRRGRMRFLGAVRDDWIEWVRLDDVRSPRRDLEAFLESGNAMISFEDRFEARMFVRDLAPLTISAAEIEEARREREDMTQLWLSHAHERFAELHKRDSSWVPILTPKLQSADEMDGWTRKHITHRFHPALWLIEQPGSEPLFMKVGQRYWRLPIQKWRDLIEWSSPTYIPLATFTDPGDLKRFDQRYGPGQFIGGS